MSIERLDLASPNLVNANFEKLAELFPNCVTEADSGKAIDFDLLKQELSGVVIEGNKERYRLEWPGKREAIVTANLPTTKTLRPVREDSVDFDTTENLYIEGDNLEVLKLLQESYLEKIKIIYIDPPYNTGNDFVYKDNFTKNLGEELFESGQKNEYNQRLVVNQENAGRYHSNWLTMMYPRLKLARNLLKNDGVIFISIDDNEAHNLRKICDEIFGEINFLSSITRKTKLTSNKGTYFAPSHEYILCYAKNSWMLGGFNDPEAQEDENYLKLFKYKDDYSRYNIVGLYQPSLDSRPNQRYYIECPDGSFVIPPGNVFPEKVFNGSMIKPTSNKDKVWRWSVDSYLKYDKDNLVFIETKTSPLLNEKGEQAKWNVYTKIYLKDRLKDGLRPTTTIEKYPNSEASKELIKLNIPFDFSKPRQLIQYLIKLIQPTKGDLVLDFFSGSSTTAHAVMALNSEGFNLNYIMVQLPESTPENSDAEKAGFSTICDIAKERIRRSAQKIKNETGKIIDYGFRVYRLDQSNMQDVYYRPQDYKQEALDLFADNVKPDRSPDDLLAQVMLDWGLPLSLKIEQINIEGKQVFKVAEDSLYACFDKGIDESFAKEIAVKKPLRIVFRDNSFINDTAKTNVKQLLKQLSPETEMKVI